MRNYPIGIDYEFLPDSYELICSKKEGPERIKLEPLISELLLRFVISPEMVISRQSLIDDLWHGNLEVGDPALTKSIFKLRQLFGKVGKDLFSTISKKGYRFNSQILSIQNKPTKSRPNINPKPWVLALLVVLAILLIILMVTPNLLHKITH